MKRIILLLCCTLSIIGLRAQNSVVVYTSNDTTWYENFADAFKESQKSDSALLRLHCDISFGGKTSSFSVKNNLTIDLNGYTLGDTLTQTSLFSKNSDTTTLRIVSSRGMGKLWAVRDVNDVVRCFTVNAGALELENVAIETRNLRPYDQNNRSVMCTSIRLFSTASLKMRNCSIYTYSDCNVYGINSSTSALFASHAELENTAIRSEGRETIYGARLVGNSVVKDCQVDVAATGAKSYGFIITNYFDSLTATYPITTITNTKINVQGVSKSFGIYAPGNVSLQHDSITVLSDTSAYSLYCERDLSLSHSSLYAESKTKVAYSLQSTGNALHTDITDSKLKALVGTTDAKAAYIIKGCLRADKSEFEAEAQLNDISTLTDALTTAVSLPESQEMSVLKNCRIRARAPQKHYAKNVYGLRIASKTQVDSCDIEAETGYSVARAISSGAKAQVELTNSTLRASGGQDIKCLTGNSDKNANLASKLFIRNCKISSRGDETVYGIETFNDLNIADSEIEVKAEVKNARGINLNNFVDTLLNIAKTTVIERVKIDVEAPETVYGICSYANLQMQTDTITTLADDNNYGIYSYAHVDLSKSDIYSESTYTKAYSLYVNRDTARITIRDCNLKSKAGCIKSTALYILKGLLDAEDCVIDATVFLDTINREIDAEVAAVRILQADSYSKIKRCKLYAQAPKKLYSTGVRGLMFSGRVEADSCEIKTYSGYSKASSITFYSSTSDLHLTNSYITSNAEQIVYGISSNWQKETRLWVENCRFEINGSDSYGINSYSRTDIFNSQISVIGHEKTRGINIANFTDTHTNIEWRSRISNVKIKSQAFASAVGITTRACVDLLADTIEVSIDSATATGLSLSNDAKVNKCEIFVAGGGSSIYGIENFDTLRIDSSMITAISEFANANTFAPATKSFAIVNSCLLKTQAKTDSLIVRNNRLVIGSFFLYDGYYSNDINLRQYLPSDTCSVYRLTDGEMYDEGYYYAIRSIENPDVNIAFVYDKKQQLIGYYKNLDEALRYANQQDDSLTVVIKGNYIVPKGEYYVGSKTTLLVPHDDRHNSAIGTEPLRTEEWNLPTYEYVKLIMSDSAILHVDGQLEVGGVQKAGGTQSGYTMGSYGHIYLAPKAQIILHDKAKMQAWGFVTGSGKITAQSGSTVYENLQIGDWKGGELIFTLLYNPQRVFPLSHYFYQNIECPITYYGGAKAMASTSELVSNMMAVGDDISIIGTENAFFTMASQANQWISKEYDPLTDRLTWTLNGNIVLNKLDVTMWVSTIPIDMSSEDYVLPIPTNMTLVAQHGSLSVSHSAVFLPSTEIIVMSSASVNIPDSVNVYLYGANEWGEFEGLSYSEVPYSPSWEVNPRDTVLKSTLCHVGGTIEVHGNLYSTKSGADIVGDSQSSGRIIYHTRGTNTDSIYQMVGERYDYIYYGNSVTSAPLTNADGSRVFTTNVLPNDECVYENGSWVLNKADGLMNVFDSSANNEKTKVVIENGLLLIELPNGQRYTMLGIRK
ncbi:MAG: hypothetical protein IKN91_06955 [Paludibacteraceae bacterium]|nr:hypothetical protein [Paludibacteraceae bacterium]